MNMFKKLLLMLAVVALIASAGTVPSGGRYAITLFEPAVVQGTVLKAGDYRLNLAESKLTIIADNGKKALEVTVKVETEDKKYDITSVQFETVSGKPVISEIRLGGTKTKLIFN
jgi:ABC-type glycerol-3-phosphate transport system substrate-binding protein